MGKRPKGAVTRKSPNRLVNLATLNESIPMQICEVVVMRCGGVVGGEWCVLPTFFQANFRTWLSC